MNRLIHAIAVCLVSTAALLAVPSTADAFCGFYVGGAGAELFNDATQVVLMRDGDQTILSMQNRYEGPVDDFAMVVPVPEVLMEANVKTLDENVFAKIDQLTAPRLVEYFEQDPCQPQYEDDFARGADAGFAADALSANNAPPVQVEAQFKVGEYEIVILSATESTALDTWLQDNEYNVPDGAAPYYQPYIESGMYFFVAKVDPAEVTFDGDRAVLSPLRFDYTSERFSLPIRLGMINSAGQQDLIVNVLARNQRYNLANYDNATIPTNIEVTPETKENFGQFYKNLFATTLKKNQGAVVTEYSWNASSCDPCPGPSLDPEDLLTLGADVIGNEAEFDFSWVVTRLHARYGKDEVGEDLVFQTADPIVGGREQYDENDNLEEGAKPSSINNFQGRYIIRHPWDGEVDCEEPVFGNWGSPSTPGSAQSPTSTGEEVTVDDSYELAPRLVDDIPELDLTAQGVRETGTTPSGGGGGSGAKTDPGCAGCSASGAAAPAGLGLLLLFGFVRRRRRRGSRSARDV